MLLKVEKLKKSYSDVSDRLQVLKGIDLLVEFNQSLAITGESGSGKSTLLHLLGILDKADSGRIVYNNRERRYSDVDAARFRNESIGFVFQYHYLLEDMTAIENIAMPNYIQTGSWKKSLELAKELIAKIEMRNRSNHYPNQLSGGEQQRVAVARALINNPLMVLADEPTGNLDQRHSDEVVDLIISLNKKKNSSLIMVTHNKEIAARMNRQYLLRDGYLSFVRN